MLLAKKEDVIAGIGLFATDFASFLWVYSIEQPLFSLLFLIGSSDRMFRTVPVSRIYYILSPQ